MSYARGSKPLPMAFTAKGAANCANCHHPIHAVRYVGWVDSLPAVKGGGTYDLCERGNALCGSLHVPEG
jgi:hypothetical protein